MPRAILEVLFKYIPMYLFTRWRKKSQQMWLITERKADARDNGYVLFKYLRESHHELDVYYAISSNAQDYIKVESLGNVVEWGTLRHYYHYFISSVILSTDFGICAPNTYAVILMRRLLPTRAKKVFLQHGITKDDLPQAQKKKLQAKLFICGAYPEYEYVSKYFGYKKNEVAYTGFARYDLLENTCTKNQILYMPTWRLWLSNTRFESSNYFEKISSFLTNKELHSYLERTCTEFVFYLHPAIRSKKAFFKRFETMHIRVMNNDDYDLQILLKSASLLITDYSSIYFDFAYLDKPVIYYHFDYEEYRQKHYSSGYFDYERDGFGPVFHMEQEVLSYIQTATKNSWKNPEKYSLRAKRFFPLCDHNNCLRHYEELCRLDHL